MPGSTRRLPVALDEAFGDEVRRWLEEHAPRSLRGTRRGRFDGFWGGRKATGVDPDVLRWRDMMAERGFTAPTWPREYGGAGLSAADARTLDQELARLGLPPAVVGFGLTMIGPTLLDYGTEAQKRRHLPAICRGEIRWCQGYSEPQAGSDLASLRTRAVPDGDAFVVDGQKVWTSYADLSDWIFCLVRTDPAAKKQQGITFLLIDMETPGVTARRIALISGASPFCEVFLEGVRVPREQVVGEVNGGWTVAKALLGYERSMIGEAIGGQLATSEAQLVSGARRHLGAAAGPLPDPSLRDAIVRNAMDERAFALTIERARQGVQSGRAPGPESSIMKVAGSELKQRRWELAVRIAGPAGLGWEGPGFAADDLDATREWLRSRANTIEGGTSEIQLDILARRVLGLPSGKEAGR
ncbi:MAG: acyl-CoA dehydrogenase family protein [Deltaproteobacteria bacterium]|nr:acyl-CoA dehydrogenase family protein [Deltaproteobacteria bacterium]